jgi:hypothetical protein
MTITARGVEQATTPPAVTPATRTRIPMVQYISFSATLALPIPACGPGHVLMYCAAAPPAILPYVLCIQQQMETANNFRSHRLAPATRHRITPSAALQQHGGDPHESALLPFADGPAGCVVACQPAGCSKQEGRCAQRALPPTHGVAYVDSAPAGWLPAGPAHQHSVLF